MEDIPFPLNCLPYFQVALAVNSRYMQWCTSYQRVRLLVNIRFFKSTNAVSLWVCWACQFCFGGPLAWFPEVGLWTVFHCSLLEKPKASPGMKGASVSRNAGVMACVLNSVFIPFRDYKLWSWCAGWGTQVSNHPISSFKCCPSQR